jgi:hypothetical protein
VLDHDHVALRAEHLDRFAQHEFDQPRILAGEFRQRHRACRRLDSGECDPAPLALGHDLLRDHQHVAVDQCDAGAREAVADEAGKIVACDDLRDAFQRSEGE